MTPYKHTQSAFLIKTVVLVMAGVFLIPVLTDSNKVFLAVCVFLLFIAYVFGSLTVEITASHLRCYFGPGWIRFKYPLNEIVEAQSVKNRWWYGWGIRLTPHGWLFNVSGLDAVQIRLKSGKKYRIGTDEPHKLETAIRHACGLGGV